MWINILFDLLRLFLQPLFYILLVFAFFVSYYRVLRERRDFHVRFYGVLNGLTESLWPGLLAGLVGTAVVLISGLVISPGMAALISALYILFAFTMQLSLMSPVFSIGIAVLIGYVFPDVHTSFSILNRWITDIRGQSMLSPLLLMGILILLESSLIRLLGVKTTPRLLPGRRGKMIGAHEARKFWFVPLCLLLPGGVIGHIGNWPFLNGGEHFSLLIVPFGIGFYQLITTKAPKHAIKVSAGKSLVLSIIILLFAAAAWYTGEEWVAFIGAAAAILYKFIMMLLAGLQRKKENYYFRQRNDGLTVLGVLPGSTAEKLGIEVGECIHKVNGQFVSQESDFYDALQQNAAFCKMEILDENNEIRFVQGALYDGIHHELGLLFVAKPKKAAAE